MIEESPTSYQAALYENVQLPSHKFNLVMSNHQQSAGQAGSTSALERRAVL